MELKAFLEKLKTAPQTVEFTDTMSAVETNFVFTPTRFTNGATVNEAGQNSGSCKLFAFAKLNGLSVEETLACFGSYYRTDVLDNPTGDDHQNIRNFIQCGWEGVVFDGEALVLK